MFKRNCPICNIELVYKQKSQVTYANKKNSKCGKCSKTTVGKNTKCDYCHNMFYRRPSDMRKLNFCCKKCNGLFYRGKYKGEMSPSWKGGPEKSNERERKRVRCLRENLKQKAVDFLGGQCKKCGYSKCIAALDFHHIDPNDKDEKFLKKCETSWEVMKKSIENCILLCSNCHREHHWYERRKNNEN
jgi:hypothetical protein